MHSERAYCPHCSLVLAESVSLPFPPAPIRCRHCRLVVGAGRAREAPEPVPGARGAAAGRYASEARRAGTGGDLDEEALIEAVRAVAGELGCRPGQVAMLDYRERSENDQQLPPLADLLAAFGTWKRVLARASGTEGAAA